MMNGRMIIFPNGSKKALTLSYDDGNTYDERLCEIMAKYGVKGTFNINSAQGGRGKRMTIDKAVEVYQKYGQEVGYHGCEHLYFHTVSTPQMMLDVVNDRIALEGATGDFIIGGAYPYGSVNKDIKDALRLAGLKYSRTTVATKEFKLPDDWLEWHPTCHHNQDDLFELLEKFLTGNPWLEQVFYLWGHSYEFDAQNTWELIEKFCQRVQGEPIWCATNGEIYTYVTAYRSLQFTADDSIVYNPTQIDVWFAEAPNGTPISVPAGKKVRVETGEIL